MVEKNIVNKKSDHPRMACAANFPQLPMDIMDAGQDSLMPLTQLTSLRQELRSLRFCQPNMALLLQPFPRLRADLLDAWFDRPPGAGMSPEVLAQWAAAPGAMCLG